MKRPYPKPTLENLLPPPREYAYFDHPDDRPDEAGGIQSARNRWLLSEHAMLAYDFPSIIKAALEPDYLLTLLENEDGGFAYLARASDHRVLSFRGTRALKERDGFEKLAGILLDWKVNARTWLKAYLGTRRAHEGFQLSADKLLGALPPSETRDRDTPWWICGHSLGGALAEIAAERLSRDGHRIAGIITCGQPRVGDADHAAAMSRLPMLRLVFGADIVPTLPPTQLDYAHSGRVVELESQRRRLSFAADASAAAGLEELFRHGWGVLLPAELRDHAPLFYATACYNEFVG